MDLQED